ncbi:MAG: N-formylglutamate amidohydrolase [Pseudomonadota bacterium]
MSPLAQLLEPEEPPVFEIVNGNGQGRMVLVCDHASNRMPRCLKNLGLNAQQLADHISWDPGAADVARALSKLLDAPLVLSGYSRLVIDCNRPLQSPESIAEQSAGVTIPGNQQLSQQQREQRIAALFQPYHQAIAQLLDTREAPTTMLLSIHSFTPALNGQQRPWQVGVSYWHDPRLAEHLHNQLIQSGDINVGYNQPYPIEDAFDHTIPVHGEGRGLASAMIEIRQNEIPSPVAAMAWAARLAPAIQTFAVDIKTRS